MPLQRFSKLLIGFAALQMISMAGMAHAAPSNVLLIFNSSGSMKKVVEGQSRMQAAKQAVATALTSIPSETRLGLMVYGHRRARDCSDIQLVSPVGAENAQTISTKVAALEPKGETPIAAALENGAKTMGSLKGQNNAILLVTDGIEECGGDPCAAAQSVKAMGLDIKVDVVGLSLNNKQRAAIECLAKETGGEFFSADNASDFAATLTKAVKVAQAQSAPPPAPPKPTRARVFFDDFKTAELSGDWAVQNPDPDAYLVDGGSLLMISSRVSGFNDPKMTNLVQLKQALPNDDWDVHVRVRPEMKSGRDQIWVGLRKDDKNYLAAGFWTERGCCGCAHIILSLYKNSGGTLTRTDRPVYGGTGCGSFSEKTYDPIIEKLKKQMATITLSKRGHSYSASMSIDGEVNGGKPLLHKTESLTSLRSPGSLTLGVAKWKKANGEVAGYIDSVEVQTLKN